MYNSGKVLGACAGAGACLTTYALPQTGMDSAVQVAVAAAAGLAVWAGIYIASAVFGKH
jgi:LPXTG-motif cell wall-anchored protein